MTIEPARMSWDTFRSGGAGGQNVNLSLIHIYEHWKNMLCEAEKTFPDEYVKLCTKIPSNLKREKKSWELWLKSYTQPDKSFPLHITYSSSAHDNSIISALRK